MKRVVAAVMVLCVWFVPSVLAQTVARLPGGQWSVTLPANWKVADEAALQRMNGAVSRMNLSTPQGPIQYVMMAASQEGDGCYLFVQRSAAAPPGSSFDGFVKGISKSTRDEIGHVKQTLGNKVSDMDLSEPEVDKERKRLYLTGGMSTGGVELKYFSSPVLGSGETITLHCYSPAATFEQNKAKLRQVCDSFAFDPGVEYAFASPKGFDFLQVGVVGIVGGVVGLTVWGIRKLTGRG